MRRRNVSKFGVDQSEAGKRARTYQGRLYRSKAEAQYAAWLDLEVRAGTIRSWKPEARRFPLTCCGQQVATILPDFEIVLPDGSIEYRETKGRATAEWNLKHRMFRIEYPDIPLVILDVVYERRGGPASFVRRVPRRQKR